MALPYSYIHLDEGENECKCRHYHYTSQYCRVCLGKQCLFAKTMIPILKQNGFEIVPIYPGDRTAKFSSPLSFAELSEPLKDLLRSPKWFDYYIISSYRPVKIEIYLPHVIQYPAIGEVFAEYVENYNELQS